MTDSDIQNWRADPVQFLHSEYLLEGGEPIRLDGWQRKIIRDIFCTRRGDGRLRYQECLIGLPRNNGKSTLLSCVGLVGLFLHQPRPRLDIYAGSRDQAGIVGDKLRETILRNPNLSELCTVERDIIRVPSTEGRATIHASDAPLSYGREYSLALLDEVHVQTGRELYDAVLTGATKRKDALFVSATTAGPKGSFCEQLHDDAAKGDDENWYFFWEHKNVASWLDPAFIDRMRKRLPSAVFNRLHRNLFEADEGSLFTPEDVQRIFDTPPPAIEEGVKVPVVIGCDYGRSHDLAAVSVIQYIAGHYLLRSLRHWRGSRENKVPVELVAQHLRHLMSKFTVRRVAIDPWNTASLLDRFRRTEEFNFSQSSKHGMSQLLHDAIVGEKLHAHPDDELERELLGLSLEDSARGWYWTHSTEHDDCVTATAMAMVTAQKMAARRGRDGQQVMVMSMGG